MVLKNGRQLTVQSYRQEGGMVKFFGLGGEISLSKDQIQAIRRADEVDQRSSTNLTVDRLSPTTAQQTPQAAVKPAEVKLPIATSRPNEQLRVTEEREYRERLEKIEEDLKASRNEYSAVTGGTASAEKSNLNESLKGWTSDLTSKLKDGQNAPISSYTAQERQLKELRQTIEDLEQEKTKLIGEMKERDITLTPATAER
jgi:transcription-repair coupling factor (superfamily II helicase)